MDGKTIYTLFGTGYDNSHEPKPLVNEKGTILGVAITFEVVAWICVAFRMYTRGMVVKALGWDDLFVVLSLLTTTTGTIGACVCKLSHLRCDHLDGFLADTWQSDFLWLGQASLRTNSFRRAKLSLHVLHHECLLPDVNSLHQTIPALPVRPNLRPARLPPQRLQSHDPLHRTLGHRLQLPRLDPLLPHPRLLGLASPRRPLGLRLPQRRHLLRHLREPRRPERHPRPPRPRDPRAPLLQARRHAQVQARPARPAHHRPHRQRHLDRPPHLRGPAQGRDPTDPRLHVVRPDQRRHRLRRGRPGHGGVQRTHLLARVAEAFWRFRRRHLCHQGDRGHARGQAVGERRVGR
ncbi:hypothetical protein CCHR01_18667 [Colletotrichum chrysophilum]|uniref:Integral membrane protein n=1 Tax=Colletotrichum chrysophilum TaxID=1836956 RepID=A0AAD9E5T6_9PEZI|nr:hypothetical protein CCHR01_18667 [Colletotrichum chrysophilum]